MRRVVVTGLGMVSPLAANVPITWQRLIAGQSGAARVQGFEYDDLACQIANQIPLGDGTDGTFNPDLIMPAKDQRKIDPFILYAIAAADEALNDADWHPETDDQQFRTGTIIGSGIGGIGGIADGAITLERVGHVASALSLFPAILSTWLLGRYPFVISLKALTTPLLQPVLQVLTRLVMRRG